MKATTTWSFAPFRLANTEDKNEIYICRVAPYETRVTFDWFCVSGERCKSYKVFFGKRDGELAEYTTSDETFTAEGLEIDSEYEFYITANGGKRSAKRLARTGRIFGTVVNYLHPEDSYYAFSGNYICSPSLLLLPNGTLLASMDIYGHDTPQNLTLIFDSHDGGTTWHYLSELCPCYWGQLFLHKGEVYMFGVSKEYGDLVIGKSTDCGKTFCPPTVLRRGSGALKFGGNHRAPMVLTEHKGRLWTGVEYGTWGSDYMFGTTVASASVDDDLLNPESWSFTELVDTKERRESDGKKKAFIEGNVVALPDGELVNILRSVNYNDGHAVVFKIDTDNPDAPETLCHDADFPSYESKFEIKRDAKSGVYYAIATWNEYNPNACDRRLLALLKSEDCKKWDKVKELLDIRDTQPDKGKEGLQYPSFEFSGDDLIYLSRTALNKPHNFHDSNYTTFHTVKNFRSL